MPWHRGDEALLLDVGQQTPFSVQTAESGPHLFEGRGEGSDTGQLNGFIVVIINGIWMLDRR